MTFKFLASLFLLTILPLGSNGQVQDLIVTYYEQVKSPTGLYDICKGFSKSMHDSVSIVSIANDSTALCSIGDSLGFYIFKIDPGWKENIAPLTEPLLKENDSLFYCVSIHYKCTITKGVGSKLIQCEKTIGPMYYLDGEPIFSEDPKENRKLKKDYRKAMKALKDP